MRYKIGIVLILLMSISCASTGPKTGDRGTPEPTATVNPSDRQPVEEKTPQPDSIPTAAPTPVPETSTEKTSVTLGCYKEMEEYLTNLVESPRFSERFPEVKAEIVSLPYELFHENVMEQNLTYDIAIVHSDYINLLQENQRSRPVTELFPDIKEEGRIFPTLLTQDGNLTAVPFTVRPVLFFYNTFLEKQISEENSTSLQSIIKSAASIIEDNNNTGDTFFLPRASDLLNLFSVYDLYNDENKEVDPILTKELFSIIKEIREKKLDADIYQKATSFQYLISQKKLLSFTGDSYYITHLKNWLGQKQQEQWYFTLFRNRKGTLLKGDYLVVDKNSTISQDEAGEIIDYLVFDNENQKLGFETFGFLPVLQELYTDDFLNQDDPFLGGFEEYKTIHRGIIQGYMELKTGTHRIKRIIQDSIYNVLAGIMKIEDALLYIQKEAGAL